MLQEHLLLWLKELAELLEFEFPPSASPHIDTDLISWVKDGELLCAIVDSVCIPRRIDLDGPRTGQENPIKQFLAYCVDVLGIPDDALPQECEFAADDGGESVARFLVLFHDELRRSGAKVLDRPLPALVVPAGAHLGALPAPVTPEPAAESSSEPSDSQAAADPPPPSVEDMIRAAGARFLGPTDADTAPLDILKQLVERARALQLEADRSAAAERRAAAYTPPPMPRLSRMSAEALREGIRSMIGEIRALEEQAALGRGTPPLRRDGDVVRRRLEREAAAARKKTRKERRGCAALERQLEARAERVRLFEKEHQLLARALREKQREVRRRRAEQDRITEHVLPSLRRQLRSEALDHRGRVERLRHSHTVAIQNFRSAHMARGGRAGAGA